MCLYRVYIQTIYAKCRELLASSVLRVYFIADGSQEWRVKNLADLLESFVAALYLDKGIKHVEGLMEVCFFPRLKVKTSNVRLVQSFNQLDQSGQNPGPWVACCQHCVHILFSSGKCSDVKIYLRFTQCLALIMALDKSRIITVQVM